MNSNRDGFSNYSPRGSVNYEQNESNTNRSSLSSRSGRSSRRSSRMNDNSKSPSSKLHDDNHHHRTPTLEDTFNQVYKTMKARQERINRLNTDDSSGGYSDYSYSTNSSNSSNNSSYQTQTNASNTHGSSSHTSSERGGNGPNTWGFNKQKIKPKTKQYIIAPYNLPNLGKDKHVSCHKDEYSPPNHSPGASVAKARARFVNGEGRFLRNILMEKQTFR